MGLRRGPSVTAHADQRTLNYRHRACWFSIVASDITGPVFACRRLGVYVSRGGQGYRVMTASNGRAALEVWARHKDEIALLLTDMIMPEGISGQQLARQLLAEKPALKVVYTSGYNAEIAGKELKLTDGVNYLAKPYELERLFRTVRAALDGTVSRPPFGEG